MLVGVCVHAHTRHTHACTHTYTHIHMCVHTYIHIHTRARARTHLHTLTHACIHTHIHTYTRIHPHRPRLFFWGSIVELRKLVLVSMVLGLGSSGAAAQLTGCAAVLLAYCCALMCLLPYPFRMLNRLHLATDAVLLSVVWANLYVLIAGQDRGAALSLGIPPIQSAALQIASIAIVLGMMTLLLTLCAVQMWRQFAPMLDVDGDGRVSGADIVATLRRVCASTVRLLRRSD